MTDEQITQLLNLNASGFTIWWRDGDSARKIVDFRFRSEILDDYARSMYEYWCGFFYDGTYIDLNVCDVNDFVIEVKVNWV